jgi:PAS domain S-box-containing protein
MTEKSRLELTDDSLRQALSPSASIDAKVLSLGEYVRTLKERWERLRACAADDAASTAPILAEALEGLQTSEEELAVADEEIRAQNEELIETRARLEREVQFHRDLFERCPDAYFVTDARGVIRMANAAAATLLNISQAFLVGKPLINFVARADCNTLRNALVAMNDATAAKSVDLRLRPRHKQPPFVAEISVSRVRPALRPSALCWTVRNGSERAGQALDGFAPAEDPRRTARIAELEVTNRHLEETVQRQARLIEELVALNAREAAAEPAPTGILVGSADGDFTGRDRGLLADLTGLRVLVAEADEDATETLIQLLTDCGAAVANAATGAQALALVEQWRPSVLVSDMTLPDQDGFALMRAVRALGDDRGGGVPAIALTGYAAIEDSREALRAGYQVHVAKPLEPALLTHAVANVAGASILEFGR